MEIGIHADTIINSIINQFDFGFMLTININTYLVIQICDAVNGDKLLSTWQKRMILLLSIFIVSAVYLLGHYPNNIVLFNSAIFAPVFWSWVLKPILNKLGIDYRKIDNVLN